LDKATVKVAKTKERLYAFNSPRLFPVVDHFRLLKVYLNTIRANNETQVLRTSNSELTLTDIYLKASIPETL
jgi:hypothetical protein